MPDIAIEPARVRQRRLKRGVATIIPVLALIAMLLWAFGRTSAGPSVRRSDLWITTVEQGSLPIVVSAPGSFKPIYQRWITAAAPGVVEAVRVQPGDPVRPDTVLATLANPEVQADYAQATANLSDAEASRASLHAQLVSQLLTLQGEFAAAQTQARTAALKERAEALLIGDHIVSTLEYTSTRLQAQEYSRLAGMAKQRITAFRGSIAAQDRAADAKIMALRAVLETNRQRVDGLSARAGIDGVVQDVAIHSGETLALGAGIARVAGLKALKVTLQVPAGEAGEIATNQLVTLELATDVSQRTRGRVSRVSPTVNDGTVEVDVMPRGAPPKDVRPNLAVTGLIHIADIPNAVYVQRPAYAAPETRSTLYRLIEGGRAAVPVRVRFGAASDQYIQVVSGLTPGNRVIVSDTSAFAGNKRLVLK